MRAASVASIAIAASGRSWRIARNAAPPTTRPRTSCSATTVAARGRSVSTASSPMWSPASYRRSTRVPVPSARSTRTRPLTMTISSSPELALRGPAPHPPGWIARLRSAPVAGGRRAPAARTTAPPAAAASGRCRRASGSVSGSRHPWASPRRSHGCTSHPRRFGRVGAASRCQRLVEHGGLGAHRHRTHPCGQYPVPGHPTRPAGPPRRRWCMRGRLVTRSAARWRAPTRRSPSGVDGLDWRCARASRSSDRSARRMGPTAPGLPSTAGGQHQSFDARRCRRRSRVATRNRISGGVGHRACAVATWGCQRDPQSVELGRPGPPAPATTPASARGSMRPRVVASAASTASWARGGARLAGRRRRLRRAR